MKKVESVFTVCPKAKKFFYVNVDLEQIEREEAIFVCCPFASSNRHDAIYLHNPKLNSFGFMGQCFACGSSLDFFSKL